MKLQKRTTPEKPYTKNRLAKVIRKIEEEYLNRQAYSYIRQLFGFRNSRDSYNNRDLKIVKNLSTNLSTPKRVVKFLLVKDPILPTPPTNKLEALLIIEESIPPLPASPLAYKNLETLVKEEEEVIVSLELGE